MISPLYHHVFPLIYVLSPNFTTNFPPWHWVYYRIYIYTLYTVYWLIVSPLFIIHYNPILSPLHHHVFPFLYSLSPNFTTNFPPWHWVYYRMCIYIYTYFIYSILIDCIPMYPHCITMFSTRIPVNIAMPWPRTWNGATCSVASKWSTRERRSGSHDELREYGGFM